MKRLVLAVMIAAVLASLTLVAQGPIMNLMSVKGRSDSNGNLMVTAAVYSGTQGPINTLPNINGRSDSSGNLLVAINGGTATPSTVQAADGSLGAPSYTFSSATTTGMFRDTSSTWLGFADGGVATAVFAGTDIMIRSDGSYKWCSITTLSGCSEDVKLSRRGAGLIGISLGAALLTAGADPTVTNTGDISRQRYQATITPSNGTDCATSFKAAALTADCTIATLPAGMKLVAVYADVTAGFTCSATCTGTKVVQAGTAPGGTQVLAASLNIATTATYGLADADLGSGMVRASAIQGGLIGSWTSTTPISARFTSGTGNWGTGAATNVNAGSIKFTLITEQVR